MRLKNKVAIVTGAGSGYGEAIAKRIAAEGASVVLADVNIADATRVADTINADAGGVAIPVETDVANSESVLRSVERTIAEFGKIDIVVSNAGISHRMKSAAKITDEEFDAVFAVNTKAILLYARHAVPKMKKAGNGGSLIIVASTGALRPRPGMLVYNASKAAAVSMSKTLALELASHQIRVNAICPVAGETPMLDKYLGGDPEANRNTLKGTIPMGRLAMPSDIAAATLYFASDETAFVTGAALEVDGGRCI